MLRRYTEIRSAAISWGSQCQASAGIEAPTLGPAPTAGSSICAPTAPGGSTTRSIAQVVRPRPLSRCTKANLASARTRCRPALANQARLVLHIAAHWLMLTVRYVTSKSQPIATAEFATLRLRRLRIAGHIIETTTGFALHSRPSSRTPN